MVDARRKNCKGVITELKKAVNALEAGERVEVVVFGIPNKVDVYAWARRRGYGIESERHYGATFRIVVRKGTPLTAAIEAT